MSEALANYGVELSCCGGRSLSHRPAGSSESSHSSPPNPSLGPHPFMSSTGPRILVLSDMAHPCMFLSVLSLPPPPSCLLSGLRPMRPTSLGQIHLASAWLLICLLTRGLPVAAKISPDGSRPANPFLDPKDDPYNPLGYIASDVLAGFAFRCAHTLRVHVSRCSVVERPRTRGCPRANS